MRLELKDLQDAVDFLFPFPMTLLRYRGTRYWNSFLPDKEYEGFEVLAIAVVE